MKVIVDNKIPYIKEAINRIADEVVFLPGADFTKEAVKDADALIVRTRTRCNRELLEGTQVKFIATATIGYDHIDTEYCREAGITWTNCPGCNAGSVEQYVRSVLGLLQRKKGLDLKNATIGVVGIVIPADNPETIVMASSLYASMSGMDCDICANASCEIGVSVENLIGGNNAEANIAATLNTTGNSHATTNHRFNLNEMPNPFKIGSL